MKKVLSFLAAIVLLGAFASSAWAYNGSITLDGGQTIYFNYSSSSQTITIVSPNSGSWSYYTQPTGSLVIPDSITYNGVSRPVATIGDDAFRNCTGLTSVTIGGCVTTIGGGAFRYCTGLSYVTIPNSVTSINNYAFADCTNLYSLIVGSGLTTLGSNVFYNDNRIGVLSYNCPANLPAAITNKDLLRNVTIGDAVTSIGNNAFQNCIQLTSITIPNSVTSIGNYAFDYCWRLASITIPNSVTSIGGAAFRDCTGLVSITIPNDVTVIGSYAFQHCTGLTSIIFNADSCITAGSSSQPAFEGCSSLTNITFGNNVKRIPNCLCWNLTSLTSITIPNSVTEIGSYAFAGCSGLTSFTIPNSVTSLGEAAFVNCSGLTSITIPNSVTVIGYRAFSGCSGLPFVTIPYSVTSIGPWAFSYCTGLTSVAFNADSCICAADCMSYPIFNSCSHLTHITFGNNVKRIPSYLCYNCSSLTSFTINGVTEIGNYAFGGCTGLTSVTIPNNVTLIDTSAFQNCTSLTSLTIGSGVTSIRSSAFKGCSGLTSLNIGSGVTSIGYNAFQNCSGLTSLNIPNNVTYIGQSAFDGCRLDSLTIGRGLTSIGSYAFRYDTISYLNYNCSANVPSAITSKNRLTTVIIGDSVTSIGQDAFKNCSSIYSVTIGNRVTSVGQSAFDGCRLYSLTIGRGLISIGTYAFRYDTISYLSYNCSANVPSAITSKNRLATVIIGNNVTSIPQDAFRNCGNLTSVTIGSGVTSIGQYAFASSNRLPSITIPNSVNTIGNYAFQSCTGLTSVTIGSGVTSIGDYAFSSCNGLTSLNIGSGVTSIGYNAFQNCSGLTSLNIPNNVTSIGEYAFNVCSGLTSVTIGNGVTSIGNKAFNNCTGLASVAFNADSCISAGNSSNPIFYGCNSLTNITFGNNVKRIPSYICYNQNSLTSVTIGSSVTSIGSYAFNGCSGLNNATIPNSVTSIGSYAFNGCSGLTNVNIPNNVTSINNYAFNNCTALTSVIFNADSCILAGNSSSPIFNGCSNLTNITFGNNVKRIPSYLCYNGNSLTSVTIGSSVTLIGSYAFYGCSGLTSVTIPNSVTSIDTAAFDDCNSITSVTLGSGVASIGKWAFRNCSSLTSVTIPNGVATIGNAAFEYCSGLTSVTIPNSVTSISEYLFNGCSSLTSVTIPNSVTSIGNHAFYNCSSLASVTIGNSVTSIDAYAFNGCSSLTPVIIPNSVTSIGNYAFYNCSVLDTVYMMPSSRPSLGTSVFGYNASGRVFILDGCSYNNYYTYSWSDPWYTYRNDLRDPIYDITVTVLSSNTARGTATIIQQRGHDVRCDSTVVVQATANSNYHFDHWSNGNTATQDTLTLTGDSTLTAYFVGLTVTSSNSSRGSVSHTKIGNHLEKITATATNNYHFDHWSNGSTATPDTITLTGDSTITAYFIGLTVLSNDNIRGSATRTKIGDHLEKITATANSNYHFDHWSTGSTANPDTITLVGDSIITAYFLPNQYTITGTSNNNARGTVSGSATVNYLDTVDLIAQPNYGYHLDHWTYTNANNSGTSTQNGGDTLTLVANKDRTATAYFNPNQYHLTVNSSNTAQGTASGSGTYDYLSVRTISATTSTGYHFTHWSNGSTANPASITLTRDSTITAYFERNTYIVTVNVNNASLGTVTTPNGTSALYQDTLIAVATPIDHHHVASWQGQGIIATSAHKDTVWVRMLSNRTLTCNFAIDTHTVAATASDIARGMVSGGGNYVYGTPCTVTATAYTGYTFQSWSNGVTANPYTFAVLEDVELTAIFVSPGEQTYTVTVSVNDPAMGSATVNGNATASVMSGTEVTLAATPNSGYRFVRWDDNNTEATRTITVTSNMSFTAYFEAVQGIEDVSGEKEDVRVYVANGRIHATHDGQAVDGFLVYDMMGREVFRAGDITGETPALPAGVYLVRVGDYPARKVVVVR